MLRLERISGIRMHTDEWKASRLAKFTSSDIHFLCGEKGLGEAGMNYIRRKVGEELTGRSSVKEIDTDSTRWGALYEMDNIRTFCKVKGLQNIVTQQLVVNGDRFGSTPDGIILLNLGPDGISYNAETLEAKCPDTFDNYLELFECDTPAQVKKVSRKYYFQVLDQIDTVDARKGYLSVYHPEFRAGNFKIIDFVLNDPTIDSKGNKTFPLHEDRKVLRERKKLAEEEFDKLRYKLIKSGKF